MARDSVYNEKMLNERPRSSTKFNKLRRVCKNDTLNCKLRPYLS